MGISIGLIKVNYYQNAPAELADGIINMQKTQPR